MQRIGVCCVVYVLALGVAPAAVVTLKYDVKASAFTPLFVPSPVPYDPVTGSFSVTFDNAADVFNSTAITGMFSVPFAGPLLFYYRMLDDRLFIGANGDAGSIGGGSDDFELVLSAVSTAPIPLGFLYTTAAAQSTIFTSANVTLTQPAAVGVPEPGTVALGGLGLCALVLTRRRRRH